MTGDILLENTVPPAPDGAGLSLFRPPWADPGYMLATTWLRYTVVPVTPGTPIIVAKADPRRWAIGFGTNGAAAAVNQVRFDNIVTTAAPFIIVGPQTLWLSLFQHGPVVMNQLWFMSSGITSVGLTEILIQ